MAPVRSWRRLCIITWLLYTEACVSGLQITPLSLPTSHLHNATNQLIPKSTLRADASCPVKGYTACGNGMADYFCCPSETTCMVLAEKTTALCCPKGSSCETISPITCDVTLQDVVENPTSPIHTTRLKESLPQCGSKCCPFGYTCRGASACVLDDGQEEEGSQTSSTSVSSSTKTKTRTATSTTPTTATQAATTTTTTTTTAVETVPAASSTPSANPGDELPPNPSAVTSPSETETPAAAAAASPRNSTSGGIIAGTTVAAIASVAGLTCLLWFKRRSLSESVGSAKFPFPRSWQQLRQNGSDQDVSSLPRYNSPPPAYAVEMKPPLTKPYTWKHYSPDSFGCDRYDSRRYDDQDDGSVPVPVSVALALAVELPATPISFSQWHVREEGEATRPRSHYEPYRRPS
ncbi:hypothetical protein CFIO01_13379 [Colletotrichum fioriniae PJ7]|uniref:GPI transamidase component PIG-S n=1 Tax=Colletotrichum fioriniae PJ7 TaxID=1445577 RepID=A0A010RY55_9PEZI|nr:hypothetical protein CFIO01_13379 [Colletotrichum fioriniae PJ7]